MSVYSESSHSLDQLQNQTNARLLKIVEPRTDEYATLQTSMTEALADIKRLAVEHSEWFSGKSKTLTTPYGKAAFRSTSSLKVEDEAKTLEILSAPEAAFYIQETGAVLPFADFLRVTTSLNLEALERLDDSLLARLGITRVTEESFTVTAAKVDMGKAVKEAAKAQENNSGKAVA
ncbi:MAG: host-nuclease inhibitor Gam family protein [Chthoniobacteraceae bacterium]|nr:host-nuclease inhibitor Gam family protein [Chthoniobacteraceae bacterium]